MRITTMSDHVSENTAAVVWDFVNPYGNVRLRGSTIVRSISVAKRIVEIMNEAHGEGTHSVKGLDYTWEERLKNAC
jgi:hypothetical protein